MAKIVIFFFIVFYVFLCIFSSLAMAEGKAGDYSLKKKDYKMEKKDYTIQFITVVILVALAFVLG